MKKSTLAKGSLTRKFLGYMLLAGIVPLVFFGVMAIVTARNVILSDTVDFYRKFVNQRRQYVELVTNDVESLIANLSGIEEIQDALARDNSGSAYDKLSTQAKIGYILSGYTNLKGLVSIDIFSASGNHFHVGETLNASNNDTALTDRLRQEAVASDRFIYWSGIENGINRDSKYAHVVTAVKILTVRTDTGSGTDRNGLLIVSYDPDVFGGNLHEQVDSQVYTLILDHISRIVHHPDSSLLGETISDSISRKLAGVEGSFAHRINGEDMMIVYAGIEKTDWVIASFIPMKTIYRTSQLISIVFVGLLVLAGTVIPIFGRLFFLQIVVPIRQVTETFRSLQAGEPIIARRFEQIREDEIGMLAGLFNSFIDARENITVQKRLERQLNEQNAELQKTLDRLNATQLQMVQQEKLAGIGQLAAGVAHEINNPLSYVAGNVGMLGSYLHRYDNVLDQLVFEMKEGSPEAESLNRLRAVWQTAQMDRIRKDVIDMTTDIQEGTTRIEMIVKGLRSFSRINPNEDKNWYDLNDGIRTTLLVANNELKHVCRVHYEPGDIPGILADGGQINQVILNLLINAAHAIQQQHGEAKGNIRIGTSVEEDHVICRIQDDGCGMTEELQKRIFEPFFTTKPVGKGTGLGLGIAYDIVVNKHKGRLDVASVPAEGTTFTIILPIGYDAEQPPA